VRLVNGGGDDLRRFLGPVEEFDAVDIVRGCPFDPGARLVRAVDRPAIPAGP